MDDFGKTFADAVSAQLEALGQNAFAVEKLGGLPVDAIRSVIRDDDKRAIPRITRAKEICDLLGLEFYIGPPRDVGPIEKVVLDGNDFAHIPLHDAMLSAGDGQKNDSEEIVDRLAFRRDWLKRIGVPASSARLARVHGDSMQPCLWAGDMIMIDTRVRSVPVKPIDMKDTRRPPIYAMIDGHEARVKRVQRPFDHLMVLLSDNPDYAPEYRQNEEIDDVQVIGKVVWWGHTAKD